MKENLTTAQKEIQKWFAGDRNYKEGLNLLEEAAPNMRTIIKHLQHQKTPENIQHLSYQLFLQSGLKDESICSQTWLRKKKPPSNPNLT